MPEVVLNPVHERDRNHVRVLTEIDRPGVDVPFFEALAELGCHPRDDGPSLRAEMAARPRQQDDAGTAVAGGPRYHDDPPWLAGGRP